MRRIAVIVSLFISVAAGAEPAITVDEIVARHLAARGGVEKMRTIATLVYSHGTYSEGDYSSDGKAFMAFKAPYFRVVGDPDDPETRFSEGYDGAAWEWYADPGVVIRTVGAASRAARHGAAYMGPFLDYRDRGTKIEIQGSATIGGRRAWDLLVTLRDGFQRHYFIDAESWLVVAARYVAPQHAFGAEVRTEARFSDDRRVNGVLFSFHNAEVDLATGKTLNEMQWGAIEANRDLPDAWFSPPRFERTPLQAFVEHLYGERTDVEAVLWSYDEFRRAHPEIDASRAIGFAGYQMLKMGDRVSAVAVLEANARDYPRSAIAAYGLGRAYEDGGDRNRARAQYQRAVALDPKYERAARALEKLKSPDR